MFGTRDGATDSVRGRRPRRSLRPRWRWSVAGHRRARAAATGSYPARDRYEPGQQVTMVGYGADVDAELLATARSTPACASILRRWTPPSPTSSLARPFVHRPICASVEVTVEEVAPASG